MNNSAGSMDDIVTLCKNRGYIFAGSEIYGGLANTWDYGPLGVELKNNLKKLWWKKFVQESRYNVGLDSSILLNSEVWEASGHISQFSDPLMDCKDCKSRYRADVLIEDNTDINISGMDFSEMQNVISDNNIKCPNCSSTNFTDIRNFNLMFKTFQGVTESSKNQVYLRPETAQGIFINFLNVQRATRKKLPFGIAQIGKSFRNEITPGNFIFRTREFEQMELEFFCHPSEDIKWFEFWQNFCYDFLIDLGINEKNIRLRKHDKEELSHYSNATTDIEYNFPFGWGELWGVASRTDFDLKTHSNHSGKKLEYFDSVTNEHYMPYVIEPSLGVERAALALLSDAYTVEALKEDDFRIVLKLHPALAPIKVMILPLSKKLNELGYEILEDLSKDIMVDFDDTGSIGKRYRRADEIGIPFCITVDFDTQEDNCVTVRDRDSMTQERIKIQDLKNYILEKIKF